MGGRSYLAREEQKRKRRRTRQSKPFDAALGLLAERERVVQKLKKKSERPSWDSYFLSLARLVATRATCDRRQVGAVLVDVDRRIVATGYNGSPRGMAHCSDAGHLLKLIEGRENCVRTLHAESNAIDYAGRLAAGCSLYVTCKPCFDCSKRIVNAGIVKVVYGEEYQSRNSELVLTYLSKAGVEVVKVD